MWCWQRHSGCLQQQGVPANAHPLGMFLYQGYRAVLSLSDCHARYHTRFFLLVHAAVSPLQGRVDDMLPMAMFDVLQSGFVCLAAFVMVAIAVPFILPVFLGLLIAFYYYR